MKRFVSLILCLALLLPLFSLAEDAEGEAPDLTEGCTFADSENRAHKPGNLYDRKYTSYYKIAKQKNPWLSISSPKGEKIYSLYICFANMPSSFEIQTNDSGSWVKICDGDTRYHHTAYRFEEGVRSLRIYSTQQKSLEMSFNEVFAFGKGEFPDYVQQWQPTVEKADIMFMVAHPDDELIFMGGGIPTYINRGKSVAVCYLTFSNTTRRSELLNGLWHMGVRNYPVIGTFRDYYVKKGQDPYNMTADKTKGGKAIIEGWMVDKIRHLKPEVVVTQDINGEYHHPQHKLVSKAAEDCIAYAAQSGKYPDSEEKYGTWQVKKFYRHLWSENQIHMDWSVPLENVGGKTGIELADESFTLFHITQHSSGYNVKKTGTEYDNTLFGLVSSTVGEDIAKNDFLENIPEGD